MARVGLAVLVVMLTAGTAHAQDDGARRDQPPDAEPAKPPQLTSPPELIEVSPPEYPPEALAAGLQAEVTVRISVDATGAVTKVDVVTPVGHGFDEAAIAAAMKYKFIPAEWDGKPGPITVETTIHFTIEQVPEETPPEEVVPPPPAGSGRLKGVVKERGTRRRLSGVIVTLEGIDRDVVTDAQGQFEIGELPAGKFKLLAAAPGFDRYTAEVEIGEGEESDATLYLRPKGGNPYETTVETESEKLEVTKRTLGRRQMTTVPGTFGDPLRVIQSFPGLSRAPFSLGILLIRGSNPDDSGVYVDDHEIPLLYHFLGGPSILNPEFLESIDLYPGGFPSRFGRAIGGIVDVGTRAPKNDGIHGSADIDLIDSSVYLRAPVGKKVVIAVAGRRSYLDTVLPFFLPEPGPGEQLIVVPYYWDYQARVDVDLPGRDKVRVMAFGSYDRLDLLQSDEESTFDLNSHVGFQRLRAAYETRIGPDDSLKLVLSASGGYDDVSFAGGEQTSVDVTEKVVGLRERVTGDLHPRVHLDAGLDLDYRITEYTLVIPVADDVRPIGGEIDIPPELFQRAIDQYSLGGWAEFAVDAGHGVKLVPGLRFDTYLLAGEPRWSMDPRLVARWKADAKTAYKAYAGYFHQAPAPEGFDAEFGNPDLDLEYAIHTGLGIERRLLKNVTVDAEAYYVSRRDLAVFTDEVRENPDGTITPLFWKNESLGRTYGLEVMLKHEITQNFYGWLSYTLARAQVQRHPDQDFVLTNFDTTHNLIAVASYRTDGGYELGLRFQFTTGRPDTPINGSTYDADDDSYQPLTGDRRSERRQSFNQLDVRAEKTWLFNTWSIGAYIDVINVYSADNPEATQWDYRYKDSAPVSGMPFFPTFGVKGQW